MFNDLKANSLTSITYATLITLKHLLDNEISKRLTFGDKSSSLTSMAESFPSVEPNSQQRLKVDDSGLAKVCNFEEAFGSKRLWQLALEVFISTSYTTIVNSAGLSSSLLLDLGANE